MTSASEVVSTADLAITNGAAEVAAASTARGGGGGGGGEGGEVGVSGCGCAGGIAVRVSDEVPVGIPRSNSHRPREELVGTSWWRSLSNGMPVTLINLVQIYTFAQLICVGTDLDPGALVSMQLFAT